MYVAPNDNLNIISKTTGISYAYSTQVRVQVWVHGVVGGAGGVGGGGRQVVITLARVHQTQPQTGSHSRDEGGGGVKLPKLYIGYNLLLQNVNV